MGHAALRDHRSERLQADLHHADGGAQLSRARALYLAYGSNLLSARLLERVPSARAVGPVALPGWEVRFHKRGWLDGSGKADLIPAESREAVAHGVLYEIAAAERELLDRAEGLGRGYRHQDVAVTLDGGRPAEAFSYRGEPSAIDPTLRPFDWYMALVLGGAREHGLPAAYVDSLAAIETVEDPDRRRDRLHRRLLADRRDTGHPQAPAG